MNDGLITVIILTFNEEANIDYALKSLTDLTNEIFIVDSYSTDRTIEIARNYTDKIYQNAWKDWATQRNWALRNLPISHEWIFFLDADEQGTPDFKGEFRKIIKNAPDDLGGINVRFDFFFLGRILRFAYESPPVLRIIRRGRASWQGEGSREYAIVDGKVMTLQNKILHYDHKGLAEWVAKQTRNAKLNSRTNLILTGHEAPKDNFIANIISKTTFRERSLRRILRKVWSQLPRFWRPFTYFFYRYFMRGGFLDGKAGFAYCFLHALWYPLLIDMMIEENCLKE
jgi:glycosyltransferase involved in cell wall biosynthesis